MNVVFASDDRYAMVAGTSMESLYHHHGSEVNIAVYILANHISNINKEQLNAIAKRHGRQVHFIDVDESQFQELGMQLDTQRWSLAAFARLLIPDLLPDLDRVLYLDCDTMIQDTLRPLWETELGDYSCAAVAEPMSVGHKRNIHQKKEDAYFNSGVMLIDLEKWRDMNATVHFFTCIANHKGHVPYVDQGVLNEVLNGMIKVLPADCNVSTQYYDFSYAEVERYRDDRIIYSKEEIEAAKAHPRVVHFTSSFLTARPWIKGSTHPYKDAWGAYRDYTPWKSEELWPNKDGISKRALKRVFSIAPRPIAIWLAKLINSTMRPLIDR